MRFFSDEINLCPLKECTDVKVSFMKLQKGSFPERGQGMNFTRRNSHVDVTSIVQSHKEIGLLYTSVSSRSSSIGK